MPAHADPHGWREEGQVLVRGIAAGMLVGLPLLYTMEMWWWGMLREERHLLVVLGLTLAANYLFAVFYGFRPVYSWGEGILEAIEAVGLSIVISAAILLLIREITFDSSGAETVGKILIEAIPISVGVSFANATVRNGSRTGDEDEDQKAGADSGGTSEEWSPEQLQLRQDVRDAGAAVGGALLFSFNAAPTEEIVLIAARIPPWHLALMVPASLIICYLILFGSGFKDRQVHVPSVFQSPLAETAMAYAIALIVSAALLYAVGPPVTLSHASTFAASTVVLGVQAAVGAAAGRLAS